LHPDDVAVADRAKVVLLASAVLRRLLERGWLDARGQALAQQYLDGGRLLGQALADQTLLAPASAPGERPAIHSR
jgi:hypothetical protein